MRTISTFLALACLSVLLWPLAAPATAQEEHGNLAWIEFQKPKAGMAAQYEDGRKKKAQWHKEKEDPWPLLIWQIMSGDDTGTYIVGLFDRFWEDFDNPPISSEDSTGEWEKSVGPYVESVVIRFYAHLPEMSHSAEEDRPSAMATVVRYRPKAGRTPEFTSLMEKLHEAATQTEWQVRYDWWVLVNGGAPEFVLVLPRDKWADFDDPERGFQDILTEFYGAEQVAAMHETVAQVLKSQDSYIIRFRPDLSYIPE
jgi:hypothetical protein